MNSSTGFALLVGIDHYENLGESAELLGSRNDVLMWHWFCRQQLGIPPENIRMLTSPALDPKNDFGDDSVPSGALGEATEEGIRKGYVWLLENMKGGQSPGLLTYSGHGLLLSSQVPALSTSSMKGDGTGAIALRDIGKAVQAAHAEEALTAVFDCCHVAAPPSKSTLRRSTGLSIGAADATPIEDEDFNVSHRVFLASRPGQHAHQGKLGRNVHGALSFALVTAAEQWKASEDPGQTGLDVNHKQLFKRARKLLRALRMKQSPKLRVPFDRASRSLVRKMPFFGLHPGVTSRKADAARGHVQIDPSESCDYCLYPLTISDALGNPTNTYGAILAVNEAPRTTFGYNGTTEYWSFLQGFLDALTSPSSGNQIQLGPPSAANWSASSPAQPTSYPVPLEPNNPTNVQIPVQSMPAVPGWSPCASSVLPANAWQYTTSAGNVFALAVSQPQTSGPIQVSWYQGVPATAALLAYAIPSNQSTTLTYGTLACGSYGWYQISLSAVSPTWCTSGPLDITTPANASTGLVPALVVDSSSTLWLFFRSATATGLLCASSTDGFAWSSASDLTYNGSRPYASSTGPAVALLDSTVFFAYVDSSTVHAFVARSGVSPTDTSYPATAGSCPALAASGSYLYLAYLDSSSSTIKMGSSSDGAAWSSPPADTTCATTANPALTVLGTGANALLYLAYPDSNNNVVVKSAPVGSTTPAGSTTLTWSTAGSSMIQASSVALGVYNGVLYLAAVPIVRTGGDNEIRVYTFVQSQWVLSAQFSLGALAPVGVTMSSLGSNLLVVTFNDKSTQNVYCLYAR